MTKCTIPDDLVERLRANGLDECDEAIDRIEQLEAEAQETALELIAAHGQAGDALDRVAKLEAAIIAALRAPDEASSREILKKARDGG
jgi:hypothetical protein